MTRVLIVSPVLAVRAGLSALLNPTPPSSVLGGDGQNNDAQLEIIGEFASLPETGAVIDSADILLLTEDAALDDEIDPLAMQAGDRLAVLLLGEGQVTALSDSLEKFRAWGTLLLDSSAEELNAAIRALGEGLIVGTPELIGHLMAGAVGSGTVELPDMVESLTERETEVLELIATGQANKQIAVSLDISEHTVKFHVSSIFSKIGASNRAEAVRKAIQQGLISF